MDSIPVNWDAVDGLVLQFAKSDNLIEQQNEEEEEEDRTSSVSSSRSSYSSRLVIGEVRGLIEIGDIDSAINVLTLHAPFILHDHRLLFLLHKQKFIELLRTGTAEDRISAINCLRTSLAPSALHAYPEAYEEFKHVLLAFIYDKDDQTSPVANEWSERRRFEIAGLMASVLRAQLHAYDPVFSMAMRYLISIHKVFIFRQGILSPVSDLTEKLLLEERDPPATLQENLYEAPPFDEVDVQALAHAVELTRQGAVDSLKFAKGDLFQAFQNELCRMRMDVSMLDELVREYCIYRGIVDSGLGYPFAPGKPFVHGTSKVNQPETGYLSSNYSVVESGNNKDADSEISVNNSHMESSPESNADVASKERVDIEERYPCDTTNHQDCSTSGTQTEISKVTQKNRSNGIRERNKRKRWRGRDEKLDSIPEVLNGSRKRELSTTSISGSTDISKKQHNSAVDAIANSEDKYDIALGMKELASRGMAAEVVDEINAMDPNFFAQNPILLFQLKQVEFLKLVSSGDHSSALRLASSHLGPLATRDPALLKPLKETLLALLRPNKEALGEGLPPLYALATSLQVAIGRRLGIEEPQLMKIMRATLYTHNEWFKLQMCKDRFEGFLKIDSLKQVKTPLLANTGSKSYGDTCTQDSSQITVSSISKMQQDSSSPNQVSSRDVVCDETAILKVMEFLALPRADAIQLLAQYNGNAEAVIQQLFA